MPLVMDGIGSTDTVKKARAWLDERGLEYAFHDDKANPSAIRRPILAAEGQLVVGFKPEEYAAPFGA